MKYEIIMFNMSNFSEWQKKGIVNRNYHIFHKLANNENVSRIIVVDFLPFTIKRAVRNYWENIIHGIKNEKIIYRDLTTKCAKISGLSKADLYVFSTIDSIFSRQRVIDKINKILAKINKKQDSKNQTSRIVWSYSPMFTNYFEDNREKGIKASLYIFDAVDNWLEHPSFVKYKKVLENNYKIIAQKSDLIFTVSPNLVNFFEKFGRKKDCYFIPLGVDVAHFSQKNESAQILSEKNILKNIPRPIIGYVGTIQQRVNIELIEYLVKKNPDKSFVFVGPVWPSYAEKINPIKKYKNVYFLGRKSYNLTPFYIRNFDVAIIPHYVDNFMKYTGSLKLLEYLACGRAVVASRASGVENCSDVIYIANNNDKEDFNKKIDRAIKNDTIELREKRIARAREYDWSLQIKEMMRLINNKMANNK